jgi:hypothetical protein
MDDKKLLQATAEREKHYSNTRSAKLQKELDFSEHEAKRLAALLKVD